MAASVGTEDAIEPGAEADVEAVSPRDLGSQRVRGHGREPQRRTRRVRLAMPQNMRKRAEPLPSLDAGPRPAASATESTSGYRTPERAVLLGNAGAITPSTRNTL